MDLQHMENSIGSVGSGTASVTGSSSGAPGTMDTMSELDFQRMAQTIGNSIQKILQSVSTIQRMVNQCNTPQDSPQLKKQLHHIMTYTNQLVSDTNNHLEQIEKCKERHLKIQRDRLIDEFTAALTAFQTVQRKAVDIEKTQIRQARAHQQYNLAKPPGVKNPSANNASNSFFDDNIFARKQQQQQQIQDEIDIQALEEQERAIQQLEKNIVGVNEIYKKLGAMFYEQGLHVDSIESSVERTSMFVTQGTENLRKASSYKNKIRKRKLIILSILILIAVIITTIIVVKLKD